MTHSKTRPSGEAGGHRRSSPSAGARLRSILLAVLCILLWAGVERGSAQTGRDDDRPEIVRLIGTSGLRPDAIDIRVAKLLLAVRDGTVSADAFFRGLKDAGAGMKEVRETRTRIQQAGMLDTFLGPKHAAGGTPVEKTLLEHRRRITESVIRETLRSAPAGGTVFVAKVGKWATQAAEALTFDGDIDFSFIAADMRIADTLKRRFDGLLRERLGPAAEARGADVVATAHGRADSEVYTGDAGQGFAEQALDEAEAKAKAEGRSLVLVERADAQGTLHPTELAAMRARIDLERKLIAERTAVLPDVRAPSDPGLSMEMVRHLLHDIKGSSEYPPGVLIVKASKYLQRSDVSAAEGGKTARNDLSVEADRIVGLSKDPDASRLADHLMERYGADGTIDPARAEAYIGRVEAGIWNNVEVSIRSKADGLETRAAEAERATGAARETLLDALREDTLKLHDTLGAERLMLESAHVVMPATIEAQVVRVTRLVERLKTLGRAIGDDELRQKRFVEEMLKSGKPTALELAAATIYHGADQLVDGINTRLDFIDDYTLGKLRGDRDFAAFLAEVEETQTLLKAADPKSLAAAKLKARSVAQRAQTGIATVNRRLNEAIQSTSLGRGATRGLVVIGLAEELPAYWNAMAAGDWRGLGMEFFRRRVPMFSAAERVFVEENPTAYVMAGWDLVTTLVPPIGLGQAALGIAEQVGEAGIEFYWDERLQLFVDEVYAGARFKPISKERIGDAWMAEWRLIGATYRGDHYDLHAFTEQRRDQLKAMAAELRKPMRSRDLGRALHGHQTGIIDKAAVDQTLRKTLMASDSLLRFLDELDAHPQAGPLLRANFADRKEVRWEEVKLAFLVETINRLEDRWAREWAQRSGQMPALMAELKRLTDALEITDEAMAALEAAHPGRLRMLSAWIHAQKRDFFLQPDAEGRDAETEEIGVIREAIAAYRAVLDARGAIERKLGLEEARDGGLRLLTGPTQLAGLAVPDREVAAEWAGRVDRFAEKVAEDLKVLKVRLAGGSMETTVLEPGFDQDMARQITGVDAWRWAWAKTARDGDTAKRPGTLDDPAVAGERLKQSRAALVAAFEAHYRGAGVLEAIVVDAAGGKPIVGASVRLGSAVARTDGQGRALLTGLQPGRYDGAVEADGRLAAKLEGLVYPVPESEGAGNRRVVRLALTSTGVEPRLSTLIVAVTDATDGKPIPGAEVTIVGAGTKTPVVRATGTDGRVRLDGLVPGQWAVAAKARDHEVLRSGAFALPVGPTGASERTVALALKRLPTKPDTPTSPPPPDSGTKPPDGTTPFGDSGTKPPDGPPTDGTPPPTDPGVKDTAGKTDPNKPTRLPVPDLSSWFMAMNSREALVAWAARTDLAPADRDAAKPLIARTEARMKELWAAALAELGAAEAYTRAIRGEIDKAYAGFAARGPKRPAGSSAAGDGGGTVTDLDGETPSSRAACQDRIDADRKRDVGYIDEDLKRIAGFRALFATFSPERKIYFPAMRAYDDLTVDHDKARWKTSGYRRTFFDACGGPSAKVNLAPAVVAPPPSASVVAMPQPEAPKVEVTIDPASRGRADVVVTARGRGGRAPYRFEWVGAKTAKEGRAVYAAPLTTTAAAARASVRLVDADGRTATAEVALEPLAITVELTRTDATGGAVAVGGGASFAVRLTAAGQPVDPKAFVLRWQASQDARFAAAEGPGAVTNRVTVLRPDRTLIWVIALHREGAILTTVAESPQIAIDAVAPGLALTVSPDQPLVGETVRITARDTPKSKDDDVSFRWELAGEAEAAGPTTDPRVYTFVAKSTKAVTVTVRTLTRPKGDALAEAEVRVMPRLLRVTAVSLGPAFGGETTRPVIWKPGKGLVTLDREIVAHQDVGLRADIEPKPNGSVRWSWRVEEGSTLSGNPGSQETRANRATPGTIEATVVAHDERGIELGRASVSVAVTVSAEAIAEGRDKARDLAQLKTRVAAAWTAGDVDGACTAARAAVAIQPDLPLATNHCGGRERLLALVAEADAALAAPVTAKGVEAATAKLRQAEAINAAAAAVVELKGRIEAARKAIATDPAKEAERKRRLDLLLAGAEACRAVKWTLCRETIDRGLAGGETVFRPSDGKLLDKARALRAAAAASEQGAREQGATEEPNDAGKRAAIDADRKRRLALLLSGAEACRSAAWAACRETIDRGLTGGEGVFRPADGKLVAKAKALRDRAAKELAKSSASPKKTPADTPGTRTEPGAATPRDRQSAAERPASGFDGIYRGSAEGLLSSRRVELIFTVAGDRITMRRPTIDGKGEGRSWPGRVSADGSILIEFSNNRWEGRISGRELAGTWRLHHGIFSDDPKTGTFRATR